MVCVVCAVLRYAMLFYEYTILVQYECIVYSLIALPCICAAQFCYVYLFVHWYRFICCCFHCYCYCCCCYCCCFIFGEPLLSLCVKHQSKQPSHKTYQFNKYTRRREREKHTIIDHHIILMYKYFCVYVRASE